MGGVRQLSPPGSGWCDRWPCCSHGLAPAHASRQTKDLATATVARAKPSAAAPPSGAAAAAELACGHAGSLLKDGFLYQRPPAGPGMFEAEKAMHLFR